MVVPANDVGFKRVVGKANRLPCIIMLVVSKDTGEKVMGSKSLAGSLCGAPLKATIIPNPFLIAVATDDRSEAVRRESAEGSAINKSNAFSIGGVSRSSDVGERLLNSLRYVFRESCARTAIW